MALEGSLQDMSLVDLIQIFRMGPKSGVLLLTGGAERGVIYVSEGRLIDAVLVRGPERQIIATGEDAVIHLLQWEDATFTFRHDTSVSERPVRIHQDSEWLVLEGIRRREHPLRVLSHQKITMETRLELASLPGRAESGVNLDLDQWRILSQIAVSQNMREICENTGVDPERAVRTVTELIAIGLVEVVAPPVPLPKARAAQRESTVPQHLVHSAPVGVSASANRDSATVSTPGRGLLNAIMRRVRGL